MPRPRKDVARRRQNLQQRRDASTGRLVSNEDLETIREKMKANNVTIFSKAILDNQQNQCDGIHDPFEDESLIEDALLSFE